jgi:hypothetical protein
LDVARIDNNTPVSNRIAGGKPITEWVREPKVGMKVRGYGATSGTSDEVPILEIRPNGEIVIPRISAPGDAGGPVVDSQNRLVGLIMGSDGKDKTFVMPCQPFLEQGGYKLVK